MSRCLRAPPLLSAAACARGARCGRGVRTAAAARGDTGPVRYGLVRHLAAQVGLGAAESRELLVGREHRAAELALHDGVEERVHERRQRGRLLLGGHEGDLDGAQACRRAGGGSPARGRTGTCMGYYALVRARGAALAHGHVRNEGRGGAHARAPSP